MRRWRSNLPTAARRKINRRAAHRALQAPHAFLGQQRAFDLAVNACDAFFALHLKHRSRPPAESTLVSSPFAPGARWTTIGGGYSGSEGAQWIGEKLHFAAHHDRFARLTARAREFDAALQRDQRPMQSVPGLPPPATGDDSKFTLQAKRVKRSRFAGLETPAVVG